MSDKRKPRKRVYLDAEPTLIYSNDVQLVTTPWDVKFRFAQIDDITSDEMRLKRTVDVYMSPQHALAFLAVLSKQLKDYEKDIGMIPRAGKAAEPDSEDETEVEVEH